MPQKSSEREAAQEAFRGAARALFISGDTIGAFLASATPGQVAACTAMLESEIAHRDRAKRARLLRQARFPVPKSVEGFDWSNVAFPDGWGRDEMCSLAFVRDAEDLVFYGQTGRGKTHMATALGIAATSAGYPVRFWLFFTTTKFRISRLISFGFHRFAKVPHPFFANCPIFPSSRLPRTFCSARRTQPADHDA